MGWGGVSRFHAEKPQTIKEKVPYCLRSVFLPKAAARKASASLGLQGQPGAPTTPALPSISFPDALGALTPCWSPGYLGSWGGWGPSCRDKATVLRSV